MTLWTVARLNWAELSPDDQAACLEWVAALGVDPRQCRYEFVVSQDERDGRYQLHLSRYVYDEHGQKIPDHAADRMWVEPVVIPIPGLPDWLIPAYSKLADTGGQS